MVRFGCFLRGPTRCFVLGSLILTAVAVASGCAFSPRREIPGGQGGTGGFPPSASGGAGVVYEGGVSRSDAAVEYVLADGGLTPCVGLQCHQTTCTFGTCMETACADGESTNVTGTVYDPAGKVPLYNVVVYVPNAALDPISEGPSCSRCDSALSGMPLATALTDAAGAFTLKNVPVGNDIPLVIQVGKWRREVKIPTVTACTSTAIADKELTRLPRNRNEGHIPKIALTTGGLDALECLLRKIGIEDSEFTPNSADGRINLYAGQAGSNVYDATINGMAAIPAASPWWDDLNNLNKYDIIIHSCEGTEKPTNKSPAALQALMDYTNAGGRVFASHWHNYWFEKGPPAMASVAMFNHRKDPTGTFTGTVDTSFPKGAALADWLVNVGGSTTRGQLPITAAKLTVESTNMPAAQRWIYNAQQSSVQYFSANTPVGAPAEMLCGRAVFSDIHVSAADGFKPGPFPGECGAVADLSPQEKALEFMLFDLSSCIQEDTVQPPIP
jgi:hypothetical protein